ncbi:hypothetical protein K466DRAFT_570311, partial [Polyporus arcularius HHB13444]
TATPSGMIDMINSNPAYEGRSTRRAMREILDSLRVELIQLDNGNYVANIFIRAPTRILREWRAWVADLRARRFPSFAIGTGRVRYVAQCSGCTSVTHPPHLCLFTRLRGWNGPQPGQGVFGDRGRSGNLPEPSANATRRYGSTQDQWQGERGRAATDATTVTSEAGEGSPRSAEVAEAMVEETEAAGGSRCANDGLELSEADT